jgi:hypothetical protein
MRPLCGTRGHKQTSVKSKQFNKERHASHSVTIEEQAVYHLCFVDLTSAGHDDRFLRRKAVVLFAFLVMMSIWLFHDSVLSMVTPRYFALLVSCNTWAVYHLCFTNLSGTTSSPVDINPKSPWYTELSINWSQYHQHLKWPRILAVVLLMSYSMLIWH